MPCECVTRSFVEADDERCEAQRNECPWGIHLTKVQPVSRRADRVVGPYGCLSHLAVGRDAHIAPPNNAFASTVAPHQRQRCKTEVNASYAAIIAVFCERVVKGSKCVHGIACADS